MKSALQPLHYLSSDIFEQEQQQLFSRLWIYACMKSAVDADQAFATRRIGGRSILIQNCGGEIRAFENACPHRLMPIQNQLFGQARMVCPYHGWVFDNAGNVKSIPKENKLYRYCEVDRKDLRLREFKIEIIGGLVFINLDEDPLPINEQFSDQLLTHLKSISSYFGDLSVNANIPVKYNWKLNFENVLDHQHIPYVHPKSFQPLVRQVAPVENEEQEMYPDPSDLLIDQSWASTTKMYIKPWPWHALVKPYGGENTYHNYFIFPNVNFISVGGLIYLVQQFEPVSANETLVRFDLCTARPTARIPALPAILRGHLKGEVEVLMEDVEFLERLQSSLHLDSMAVNHGQYEHRLVGFGLAYLRLLQGRKP